MGNGSSSARPAGALLAFAPVALAVALVLPLLGGGPAFGQRPAEGIAWTGQVVDQQTLQPVPAARVGTETADASIVAGSTIVAGPSIVAGPDGHFEIRMARGQRLRITAPGFLDGFVELHAYRESDLGRLVLRRELSLAGRLVRNGEPVAGATVVSPVAHDRNHGVPTSSAGVTTTGPDGRFRVGALRPERLSELLFVVDDIAQSIDLGHGLFPIDARHYELGDLEIAPHRSLRGRVVDDEGAPIVGAIVWPTAVPAPQKIPPRGSPEVPDGLELVPMPTASSDADGFFQLDALPGPVTLGVFHMGHAPATIEAFVEAFSDPAAPPRFGQSPSVTDDKMPPATGVASRTATDIGVVMLAPGITIAGRVTDPTGVPLDGADVAVSGMQGWPWHASGVAAELEVARTTRTDGDGCFRLPGMPADGPFSIEASASGYASRTSYERRDDRAPQPIGADPAEPCGPYEIELSPAGRIVGRVADDRGEPIPGVQIHSRHAQTPLGYLRPGTPPVTSAPEGTFEMPGLLPGEYDLTVREYGYRTVTVPSIEVDAARTTDVAIELVAIRATAPLEVRVFDPRGAPEPDAEARADLRVNNRAAPTPSPERRVTGADGRVLFAAAPIGVYSVQARADGVRRRSGWRGPFRVEPGADPAIVRMREPVRPAVHLAGRLVDAEGRGVVGVIVEAHGNGRADREHHALTEAGGVFRFASIPAGPYLLAATHHLLPPFLRRELIVVDPPGVDALLLSVPRVGAITGTVTGLRGVPENGWVTAYTTETFPDGPTHSVTVRERLQSDGTFRLDDLIPGAWTVSVKDDDGREASAEVAVPDGGGAVDTTIALPSGFRLTGTVRWRGDPSERASIRISGNGADRRVEFDGDGFEVLDLSSGPYRIWLTGTGLRSPFFDWVEVRGDTHVEIRVRGGAVSGTLVDADSGEPVPGAYLRTDPIPQLVFDAHDQFHRTDRDGRFRVGPFPAGPWRFEFSAPGYAHRQPVIDIADEDLTNLRIETRKTPGLDLRFVTPGGALPGVVRLRWYDAEHDESYEHSAFPASNDSNEFHFDGVPLGPGVLLATTSRPPLAARLTVENRGQVVDVELGRAGGLDVVIPELTVPGSYATLRVFDGDGVPVLSYGRFVSPRRPGPFPVRALPPGIYRVEVTATLPGTDETRSWSGEVEVLPLQTVEVVLT